MHVLRRLTRAVFGCFHGLERFFDRWTSRAGPIFVVLCSFLLFLGTVTYCQCMLVDLPARAMAVPVATDACAHA